MKTDLKSLSLAYLTIERNPPPYYSGENRIRENLKPELTNLKARLRSISLITSRQMSEEITGRISREHFGVHSIGPIFQNAIITPIRTRVIQPVRKLLTEFSVFNYLLLFAISFISVGVMVMYSTW